MSTNCEKCGQQIEYNGWKNYETWVVALWIDNEPHTYEQRRQMAREAIADATPNPLSPSMDTARWDYEQALRQWIRDEVESQEAGLASDLLGSALDNVDWREIAQNWIDEERENMPQTEEEA